MSQDQTGQKEQTIEMCGPNGFYRIPLSKYNEIVSEQNPAAAGWFPTLADAMLDADSRAIAETQAKIDAAKNRGRRTRTWAEWKEILIG